MDEHSSREGRDKVIHLSKQLQTEALGMEPIDVDCMTIRNHTRALQSSANKPFGKNAPFIVSRSFGCCYMTTRWTGRTNICNFFQNSNVFGTAMMIIPIRTMMVTSNNRAEGGQLQQ